MMRLLVIALSVVAVDGCWLSSKEKAVRKMEAYVARSNLDVSAGITQSDLETGIAMLPATAAWMLRTFTDTTDIFARCDVDADGRLTFAEIRAAPQCVSSCIKQLAITKFL